MAWGVKTLTINKNSNNGKPIQCPFNVVSDGVQLKANRNNEGSIYIGPNVGVYFGNDESFPLDALDTILMPVKNTDEIWIKTDSLKDVKLHLLIIGK